MMRQLTLLILVLVVFLIPLDNFFLNWLNPSSLVIIVLSQIPDFLILCLFSLITLTKVTESSKFSIIGNKVDFLLLIFFFIGSIVLIFSDTRILDLAIGYKSLFRYFTLIYILLNVNLNDGGHKFLIKSIESIILIEVLIGVIQIFISIETRMLFLPPPIEEISQFQSVSRIHLLKDNIIFGTMDKSIEYALFLLIALVLWLNRQQSSKIIFWGVSGLLFTLIYLTASRSTTIAAILVIILNHVLRNGISRFILITIITIPIILVFGIIAYYFIDFESNSFTFAFTSRYLEIAQMQRLGTVTIVLPHFFESRFIHILFGYGPDINIVSEHFSSLNMIPFLLEKHPGTLEDVYWVALLYYFGMIGLTIILMILVGILKQLKRIRNVLYYKKYYLANAAVTLVIISFFLNFFNQAFEIRTFSFFLWLIVGLSLSNYKLNHSYHKNTEQST